MTPGKTVNFLSSAQSRAVTVFYCMLLPSLKRKTTCNLLRNRNKVIKQNSATPANQFSTYLVIYVDNQTPLLICSRYQCVRLRVHACVCLACMQSRCV